MKRPAHLEGNTALTWMYERRVGNQNWIMEGIKYLQTDEEGKYMEDRQIVKAFELHTQDNQLIVVHHPNCLKDKDMFRAKIKTHLEKIYQGLQERF